MKSNTQFFIIWLQYEKFKIPIFHKVVPLLKFDLTCITSLGALKWKIVRRNYINKHGYVYVIKGVFKFSHQSTLVLVYCIHLSERRNIFINYPVFIGSPVSKFNICLTISYVEKLTATIGMALK